MISYNPNNKDEGGFHEMPCGSPGRGCQDSHPAGLLAGVALGAAGLIRRGRLPALVEGGCDSYIERGALADLKPLQSALFIGLAAILAQFELAFE